MPPIPCAHCGNNFMRQDIDPEAEKLCNTCTLRKPKQITKKNMENNFTISFEIPRDIYIQVEEKCTNEGCSFADYFLTLHKDRESEIKHSQETQANTAKKGKK